jgi:hypothetical protein
MNLIIKLIALNIAATGAEERTTDAPIEPNIDRINRFTTAFQPKVK